MKIKYLMMICLIIGNLNIVGCESTDKETETTYENNYVPVEETIKCKDCGNEVNNCTCVGYECVNCGQWHTEEESYYNEDGMSACSEECFNQYTGQSIPANSGNCDPVENITEADDYKGKQIGPDCFTCGCATLHDYSHTEFRKSGVVIHIWNCENCGERYEMISSLN